MPPPLEGSPVVRALLRALAFVGPIEAIFFHLLPPPDGSFSPAVEQVHWSVHRAGELSWAMSMVLAIILLTTLARIAIVSRIWPPGLNGLLAFCMMAQAALAISTSIGQTLFFATTFALMTVLAVTAIAAHAFPFATLVAKAFLVVFVSSVVCSALTTTASVGQRLDVAAMPDNIADAAYTAGLVLLGLSGVLAFLTFAEKGQLLVTEGPRNLLAIVIASATSLAFAWACLLADPGIAPLGPRPSIALVLLLSFGVFTGTLTIALNLFNPERRFAGYGLLLLLLAGFPQRVLLQGMFLVLGAALLLAPRRQVVEAPVPPPSPPSAAETPFAPAP